jgi:hypothetical protein
MKSSRLVTALVVLLGLGAPAISFAGCDASCRPTNAATKPQEITSIARQFAAARRLGQAS